MGRAGAVMIETLCRSFFVLNDGFLLLFFLSS